MACVMAKERKGEQSHFHLEVGEIQSFPHYKSAYNRTSKAGHFKEKKKGELPAVIVIGVRLCIIRYFHVFRLQNVYLAFFENASSRIVFTFVSQKK